MPPKSYKAATKNASGQRRRGQPITGTQPASVRARASKKPARRGKRGR